MLQERWKINETPAHVYSYESTQWELIPMNTNMIGFRWFSELVVPCALDTPSLVLELEGLNLDIKSHHYPMVHSTVHFNWMACGHLAFFRLEELFFKYGVDLVIQAQEGFYERSWPVYKGDYYANDYIHPHAPVYVSSAAFTCDEGPTSPGTQTRVDTSGGGEHIYSNGIHFMHQSTGRLAVPGCTTPIDNISKNEQSIAMIHVACESMLCLVVRPSLHPCPGNWVTVWRAVMYRARTAHAFSAGIECRHCSRGYFKYKISIIIRTTISNSKITFSLAEQHICRFFVSHCLLHTSSMKY